MKHYKFTKRGHQTEWPMFIVLAGMMIWLAISFAKNINEKRLYEDMHILSMAIHVYHDTENEYPVSEKITLSEGDLLEAIQKTGDSATELYKVDLEKTGKHHAKLRRGYEKKENDFFIYSLETNQLFYARGIKNETNKSVFGFHAISD